MLVASFVILSEAKDPLFFSAHETAGPSLR
jgi:hypothetical protein